MLRTVRHGPRTTLGQDRTPNRPGRTTGPRRAAPFVGRAARGFSLVELVLVLAVIAALAGLAMPRWSASAARYRADQAALRVVADLRLVRDAARTGGAAQRLAFTADSAVYTSTIAAPDGLGGTLRVDLGRDPYRATVRRADFGGATTAQFGAFGTPAAPGWVLLQGGAEARVITLTAAGDVAFRRASAEEARTATVTLAVDSRRINLVPASTGTTGGTTGGTGTTTGPVQTILDPVTDLLGI